MGFCNRGTVAGSASRLLGGYPPAGLHTDFFRQSNLDYVSRTDLAQSNKNVSFSGSRRVTSLSYGMGDSSQRQTSQYWENTIAGSSSF